MKIDYISLGNNCDASLSLRELGVKQETYPFDWVRSNTKIIYDVLVNGPSKYLRFGKHEFSDYNIPSEYEIKDMYACFNKRREFMYSHINYYGQHFMHYTDYTMLELKGIFERYLNRFFEVLNTSKKIFFFHTTENYILHKLSRDNKEVYYDYLVKISDYFRDNYPHLDFKIFNIEIDNRREDTDHIIQYSMNYDLPFLDYCEDTSDEFIIPFRSEVTRVIKEILQ